MNIPNSKKHGLAKKLEKISSNVSKRPVYIVQKQGSSYALVHYFSKKVLVDDIPFANTAKSFANKIHKSKTIDPLVVRKFKSKIEYFYKHYNDAMFYRHTMATTKDSFKFFATEARLKETIAYLKEAKQRLINF